MRSMDEQKQSATFGRMTSLGLYGALIGLAVGGFLVVRYLGSDLVAPEPGPGAAVFGDVGTKKHVDVLMHVLLALSVVIITARALGALFARLRQPPVIGEVVAGILLGPSLLGRVAPEASAFLLPPTVAPSLQILAAGRRHPVHVPGRPGAGSGARCARARTPRSPSRTPASSCRSCSGAALALLLYPRVLVVRTCRSRAFALFWAWRCRSRRSRCWRAS